MVKDFGIGQMEIRILGLPAQSFVGGLCVHMIVKGLLILMAIVLCLLGASFKQGNVIMLGFAFYEVILMIIQKIRGLRLTSRGPGLL